MRNEIPDSDSTFRFFIDYPLASSLSCLQTVIAGWCFRKDNTEITAVRARTGASYRNGSCGIPRPDVAKVPGSPSGARPGFEIVVPIKPGLNEYYLEAQLNGGIWQEFSCVRISSSVGVETLSRREAFLAYLLPRFFRNSATDFDFDSAFRSYIDRPIGSSLRSLKFVISGWCFHRGGERIIAVRSVGGIRNGLYGISRPDVAAVHGKNGDASGFEIGMELLPGSTDCKLEAQLNDGTWHQFYSRQLIAPSVTPRKERHRWMRFWRRAIEGDPSAWELATEAEKDYLLHKANLRGLVSIGKWVQHEPRPITIEKYPVPRLTTGELPSFTIVTPSFNHADFLEATMKSILDQPDVRIDYIVQDGESTDGSVEIIRRVAAQYATSDRLARIVRWTSEPDDGQADAIRKGFENACGGADDIMAFLNSDDLFMPNALRFVAEFFAAHPEVDVVYGHRVIIDKAGLEIGRWYSPRAEWDDIYLFDLIPQETLFWRRRIWDRVGGIDVTFQFALDWDLLLRFRSAGARFARLPWHIGQFRYHSRQKTQVLHDSLGIQEMEKLRLRTFGETPSQVQLQSRWNRAIFDSSLVQALLSKGRRV